MAAFRCRAVATRQLSTSAVARESVKDAAKETAKKAESSLEGLQAKAQQIGGPIVKKVESLLGGYSEPLKYNLKVAGSLAKQVYVAEGLAPPTSVNTVTSAYKTLWSRASNINYWTELLSNGGWKKVGIYAVEAYGIFTIGEMIGRRSLVGYKLDTSAHGHGHH
ncbi:hypothetical protein IE53DRAFT_374098 [Violaceomyces palustris]|uniref:Uncharacterized protein n=1 Tax=Violaceomyces palustris TaxID=1673888 RepID=A0ACD0P019_9BASI|nr:hypothetical protein IE53DRAFT_374098 [Violaceomyces palustris]